MPWGLIGMIGLVVAIERYEVRPNRAFSSVHAERWRFAAEALKQKAQAAQIVCFGDSLVHYGVVPRIIERAIGKPVTNLAVSTGPPPASYFLLRRLLRHGARPRAVLVDFESKIILEGPTSRVRPYPWADFLSVREAVELCRAAGDPELFARIGLAKVLHSYKNRFEIRGNILSALRGQEITIHKVVSMLSLNWQANVGAQINPKSDWPQPPEPPSEAQPGTWVCDPVNRAFMERFLELAERSGVAVFWIMPPVSPNSQAHLHFWGEEGRYDGFVREIRSRHPSVVVIDGRRSGYDRSVFTDDVHLDRDGAIAYSASLAGCLERYFADPLAFPRVVKLPGYRTTATDVPVEDIVETAYRLATGAVIRR
jgi:hypothetical protein